MAIGRIVEISMSQSSPKCKKCGGSGKTYEDCGPYESGWRVCTECTAALPTGGSGTAPPKMVPCNGEASAMAASMTKPVVLRAEAILERALAAVRQRGKDYDKPQGERSFHELAKRTGMSPSKACEFLIELKKVRLDTTNWTHEDSLVDLLAYYALWAELKQEEPVAGVRSNHPYEG